MSSGLVSASELHHHNADPHWVVLDCRFDLARPEAGRQAFDAGHIPHARYADLERDLSGPVTKSTGRHPLPDPEALAATLGGWGIDDSVQVVVYDARDGAMAARAWWLLRWLGHRAVAVLDGGLQAWRDAGYPLVGGEEAVTPRRFPVRHPVETVVTTDEVANAGAELVLWDARTGPRYRGEEEPIDPVAGHIPGARNRPYQDNLRPDGRFLSPEELAEQWRAALGGVSPRQVAHYCGSGVTACHNLLAMELAGFAGSRLYAGSWSEWIRDPGRPVARG